MKHESIEALKEWLAELDKDNYLYSEFEHIVRAIIFLEARITELEKANGKLV